MGAEYVKPSHFEDAAAAEERRTGPGARKRVDLSS
jgi:hypothetical protein